MLDRLMFPALSLALFVGALAVLLAHIERDDDLRRELHQLRKDRDRLCLAASTNHNATPAASQVCPLITDAGDNNQ